MINDKTLPQIPQHRLPKYQISTYYFLFPVLSSLHLPSSPFKMAQLSTSPVASHDIKANIAYFPPSPITIPPSTWKPRHLGHTDAYTRKMTIHDIRGQEENFSLDRNGFEFVTLPEKERRTDDDEVIVREYYPEVEALARKMY